MNKETNQSAVAEVDEEYEEALRHAFDDYEKSVGAEASDEEATTDAEESESAPAEESAEPQSDEEDVPPASEEEGGSEEAEASEEADGAGEQEGEQPQESAVVSLLAEKEQRILAEIHDADPSARRSVQKIADLADPERFIKLIRRGYDTADAYWLVQNAPGKPEVPQNRTTLQEKQQSKNHMRATSSSMKTAGVSDFTESDMRMAREALPGVSDKDLRKYWKRANNQ